jgi:hypothetical protein
MTPEISEFSYGFALTNELVGWAPLAAAPVFPSLIEEGKAGGGYDVKLELPAVALYLQFKRSDRMTRKSAKERKAIGPRLSVPYHRFHVTEAKKSNQHNMLIELDDGMSLVFYAAPRFHALAEINWAWAHNAVSAQSIFVAPSEIGALDNASHSVAFDYASTFLCSDPKKIQHLTNTDLLGKLQSRLAEETRPLRQLISHFTQRLAAAEVRGRARGKSHEDDSDDDTPEQSALVQVVSATPGTRIPVRPEKPLTDENATLRELADSAARIFDSQLIIVQAKA